ncbi:uncharacterized protein VP01_276g6 [Puccinia sorghi]|uniref:Major facilitator superfamily (MFS) profile domain-containing protein n=1 Tax=Puccinia sorghi TaxID=27349 RepID=A0A0L6V2V2_9BASI|nr:uncharacterized protein VP01_276g6 [Puccinia sorghi]
MVTTMTITHLEVSEYPRLARSPSPQTPVRTRDQERVPESRRIESKRAPPSLIGRAHHNLFNFYRDEKTWLSEERRAILKLDFIEIISVLPLIVVFYFFSSLDRSNIGNARVAGKASEIFEALGSPIFSSTHFHVYVSTLRRKACPQSSESSPVRMQSLFYHHTRRPCSTYVLVKVPANLALKRVGAHIFLPLISGVWGLIVYGLSRRRFISCMLFVFVSKSGELQRGRFMPRVLFNRPQAILLYLSNSYSRDQLQMRIAIFYSSASLSGSFSGLLAYAILHLHETWGKPAWAWLFFIEGAATMVFAVIASFIFPASIASNRLLREREKEVLLNRLARKAASTLDPNEKFKISEVVAAIKSPHVILLTITQFMSGTAAYSVTYFTPTSKCFLFSSLISKSRQNHPPPSCVQRYSSLGYSPSRTQLMTSPPFAVAFVVMLAGGYFSDRYHARALTAGVSAAVAFIGFLLFLLLDPSHTHAKYGSLFLAIPGVFSLIPPIGAWAANNSDGHYRRATAIAFSYSTSTVGGILSTWLFPQSQAPRYRPGIIVNLVWSVVLALIHLDCAGILLGVILNYVWLRYANHYKSKNRSRILEPYDPLGNGIQPDSPEFLRAWTELGDKHPDFKYVY